MPLCTREVNELRDELRSQMVFKAIYYDDDYGTSWIHNPEAIANFFADRGFEILSAAQLGRWVDERMEYNEAHRSILVFAQDMMPNTVADLKSPTCKLRLFLDNGARVVWHGDVPFWYQALPAKRYEEWRLEGAERVLEIRTLLAENLWGHRLVNGILTKKGRMWGMMLPGPTQRPVIAQDVNDVFTVGPPIKPHPNQPQINTACSWRKIYNQRFPHSGFLRYWPAGRNGEDISINTDYFRFAVSGWNPVPDVELPEIEAPDTEIFVSGNEFDLFRPANTNDAWQLAAIERVYWSWIQIPEAQWIWWKHWVTPKFQVGGAVEHKREFELNGNPQQATLMLAVDDIARDLRVNGTPLGNQTEVGRWDNVLIADLTPHVQQGRNLLEMTVVNASGPQPNSPEDNPTGLCYRIDVVY